jgi:hypothetical protein
MWCNSIIYSFFAKFNVTYNTKSINLLVVFRHFIYINIIILFLLDKTTQYSSSPILNPQKPGTAGNPKHADHSKLPNKLQTSSFCFNKGSRNVFAPSPNNSCHFEADTSVDCNKSAHRRKLGTK